MRSLGKFVFGPNWESAKELKAKEEARQERIRLSWSAPACDALLADGKLKLVVSESVRVQGTGEDKKIAIRYVPVAGTQDLSGFKSTQASQWSTADEMHRFKIPREARIHPLFSVDKTPNGLFFNWHNKALKHDVDAIKFLTKNPKLITKALKNARATHQWRRDTQAFI